MKLSEAFASFRTNEILALGKSPKTNESYVYAEKITIAYFGDINIRKISVEQIHQFYLWMCRNHAANTARGYICNLRSVLSYHQRNGVRGIVNVSLIKTPQREKKMADFLTTDEFVKFIDELGRPVKGYSRLNRERNVLIAKMLFLTGLRVSELCALNRDSIKDRQFSVIGKSKDPRPCFITRDLEQDLKGYLDKRTDNEPALFIANQTGERITPGIIRSVFRRASVGFGRRVTPHTLRHSYATRMVDEGVDIRYVAELLGHQNLETTQKYTHIRDYRLRLVYENVLERC